MGSEREVRETTANRADGRNQKYTRMRKYHEYYRINNMTRNVPTRNKYTREEDEEAI